MNVFNRLLVILLDLILLLVVVLVLIVTWGVYQPQQLSPLPWIYDRLYPFAHLDPTSYGWSLGITIALIVLGLFLLFVEIITLIPRGEGQFTLKESDLGRVTVNRDVVRDVADREAIQVPGVMGFRTEVRQEREGLAIRGRLEVAPDANVPEVTREVQDRVKAGVERTLGWPVRRIQLSAQLAPLGDRRRVH